YKSTIQKKFIVNNKKTTFHHPDRLRVVLFTPDDLYLIKGSPSKRREFIDFTLKQVSEEYIHDLNNYSKILKKRNLLLKNEQTNSKSFNVVNSMFTESAAKIILKRVNFINLLDELSGPLYEEINQQSNKIKLRYALSFIVNSDKINLNILQSSIEQHILENHDKECKRKRSMVGPHLDDINIYQDGKIAKVFASQGQQRNMVISLKLAEMYAFQRVKGFFPVFLMDEVLAELDENKKNQLIKHLQKAPFQVYISSVDFSGKEEENRFVYLLKKGQLIRKE
ncbi:MAG: DNA replication and repair protein RecF, partial [Bacillota bacterium]|nr:DNA replication and repair protein RecF [Bacillota bacterium]